jgi:hypothetical protein
MACQQGIGASILVAVYQLFSNRIIQKLRLKIDAHGRIDISPSDIFTIGTFDHVRDLDLWLFNDSLLLPVFSQSRFPLLECFFYRRPRTRGDLKLPYVPWSQLRRLDLSRYGRDVPTTLGLLSQCTLIEECKLLVIISGSIVDDGPKVTLHDLRCLELGFIHVLEEDFEILNRFFSLLSFPDLQSLCMAFKEEALSLRVKSPLARNLTLMAPQLRHLHFDIPLDASPLRTIPLGISKTVLPQNNLVTT